MGLKRFYQRDNVGKAKYTINEHDGVSTHKDGSDFFGIAIFKNKVKLKAYVDSLVKSGYKNLN